MPDKTVGISLLGCGVVGGGVLKILHDERELLRRRTGLDFDIRHIVVRDPGKPRWSALSHPLTTDAHAAIDDPRADIIVELIGGEQPAGEWIERALGHGKHVVTANKSLLASRGAELFALARARGGSIGFEASCGGGIPIIQSMMHGLVGNRIDALVGIVNGTCNFILTQMTRRGASYADALKQAQAAGFAEADPTMDVSGRDAAQKLALLAGLAFNVQIKERDIHVEGIDRLQAEDITFAHELGYVIKLLAIAERPQISGLKSEILDGKDRISDHRSEITDSPAESSDGPLILRVHPTLVDREDVLADVGGSFNAISVYAHALGHALFYGRGAGQLPTASAVVADIVSTALGLTPLAFQQLNIFPDTTAAAQVLPFAQLRSRYYLRLMARDEPGVLAQVTRILGDQRISLRAVLQHESDDGQHVPVVITTHLAEEGRMQAALAQLDALGVIAPPTVCLRIIDLPTEYARRGVD